MKKIKFTTITEACQGIGEVYLIHPNFNDNDECYENFFITDRGAELIKPGRKYKVTIEEIKNKKGK